MPDTRLYVSTDGCLRFLVVTEDDGDVSLGFDGSSPHTHADVLAGLTGLPEKEAVEQYVRGVLENRSIIAVSRQSGRADEVWVSDDPSSETRYLSPGESINFRYWDGSPWVAP